MGNTVRILVVDDFTRGLEAMDYKKVIACANGKEALDLLATKRVDLIISDLNMPVMNDQTLLENIRADDRLRVVLISKPGNQVGTHYASFPT